MKTLPRLYQIAADLGFADLAAVEHVGRTLRDENIIATGKRGRGAAPATACECAALLLALTVPARTLAERIASVREIIADDGAALADRFAAPRDYRTAVRLAPGITYEIKVPAAVFRAFAS